MYRFHPSVRWGSGYPNRQEIVSQIEKLWKRYGLEDKTKFNTKVTSLTKDKQGRWIVNDPSNGRFDGVIAALGTCGDPKMPYIEGQETFRGEIYHSSKLDGKTAEGKKVLIIGGGASAVEGLEFVISTNAASTAVLSRSDKWMIPRNAFVDMLLAFNIFGQETMFSWIPEKLLRLFFYRDLEDLAPTSRTGLFTETPMVNSDVLRQIREGKAQWFRGDIIRMTENGILFNHRARGVPKNGPGREEEIKGDMVIMATGYKRPSLAFVPKECFQEPYQPPNWYLQCFPPEHMDICAINTTYTNAIDKSYRSLDKHRLTVLERAVGNWHIVCTLLRLYLFIANVKNQGIYTRLLLVFLVDPLTTPREYWMKRWIDMTRFIKRTSPTGAFDFFTYSELIYWFMFCVAINPFRWKWALFVFFGIGTTLPMKVVEEEDRLRNGLGVKKSY